MNYQYQIDYGAGYEEVYLDATGTTNQAEDPAAWLAAVEAEGRARRARVLLGGQDVAERVFECVVVESRTEPGGSTRHMVQCSGGEVSVYEQPDDSLSGSARPGYIGDADQALGRAFEAVRSLGRERQ